ncbi:hypothetical protein [Dictyobacter formicarum]|uniref:DUF4020 domain-containing protein n=1 Tax=Dictyobacter formicarum TaxID=2778368 RepID=A0ABQ3VTA5_9CHLR|nr:hypothetical protein [Dictyobacter formicarum]GHO89180.1 hypothetical protein KSZ_71860 [Dictyobacter formicarum]
MKNKDQQDTGITKDEVLDALIVSGRPNFNKRLLTHFSTEKIGLLPPLRRTSRPGSNKPVYVWDEHVKQQIVDLYDLVERGCRNYQNRLLYLWMRGYMVPFEPIRQHWIQTIDTFLYNLTAGEQDPEDALWHISSILVQFIEPKWKFSPRPDNLIRNVGFDQWRELQEFIWDILAVPTYEPEETTLENVLAILRKINTIAQAKADPEGSLSWILSLREIFTLPRYRDALINATIEQWIQARDCYLEFCQCLYQLATFFPKRNASLTNDMRQALFLKCGAILLPLLLMISYYGYEDWIHECLAILHDLLDMFTDPDFGAMLSQM